MKILRSFNNKSNSLDCLNGFDSKWKEKFGPDSTTVMSLNEFDQFMKEVIDFDGEC